MSFTAFIVYAFICALDRSNFDFKGFCVHSIGSGAYLPNLRVLNACRF